MDKEQQVLAEYRRLVENLTALNSKVSALAGTPASDLLDDLRAVERKTGLVFTLFKSSVWAILADLPGENEE
ncbi:hypothetical protein PYCC9005_001312 [Savitreella phatthalungensis]